MFAVAFPLQREIAGAFDWEDRQANQNQNYPIPDDVCGRVLDID